MVCVECAEGGAGEYAEEAAQTARVGAQQEGVYAQGAHDAQSALTAQK